jgi:hypothetical protein
MIWQRRNMWADQSVLRCLPVQDNSVGALPHQTSMAYTSIKAGSNPTKFDTLDPDV